jgi:hypothetical protein
VKFETLIVLVIAFNVVTAVLKNRARKAKLKNEMPSSPAPTPAVPAPSEAKEIRRPTAPHQIRKAPVETTLASVKESIPSEKPKPVGLGKDLLDQLAKELGLQLPQPTLPKPVPSQLRPMPVPETSRIPMAAPITPVPTSAKSAEEGHATVQKRDAIGPLPRFAAQLRDRVRVQEAFMLKEILDPPLALRRKHP